MEEFLVTIDDEKGEIFSGVFACSKLTVNAIDEDDFFTQAAALEIGSYPPGGTSILERKESKFLEHPEKAKKITVTILSEDHKKAARCTVEGRFSFRVIQETANPRTVPVMAPGGHCTV